MSTLFGKSKKRKRSSTQVSKEPQEPFNNDLIKATPGNASSTTLSISATFEDLGLAPPLISTCRALGFSKPTPVQRTIIPFLLKEDESHVLCLAATGSGKTAAFVLPALHKLAADPYGIFAVVLTPTRELAKQIHQQVLALGSSLKIQSALVVGGLDAVRQSCELDKRPHFCVATPGRLAELLRGPCPPKLRHVRYLILDEADRLLASNSGFERDVAELLLHITVKKGQRRTNCQTLLFSATFTKSLESVEEMAGAGLGRLPLKKFVVRADGETASSVKKPKVLTPQDEKEEDKNEEEESATIPKIPAGLKQEYIFMPSRVRDAYLLTAIRHLITRGGRRGEGQHSGWTMDPTHEDDDEETTTRKARSAIVFVSTCERAALVSGILRELGVDNVALHSLLSQNRRLAALGKFKSQHVRILVATDVASRGLDIPTVDLVLNAELPRRAVDYIHRVGRTARAGQRGRAVSLVAESDVGLVHAAERLSGRELQKCEDISDDMALKLLGPVTKASRLAKMKLMDIGFNELVEKMKKRKARDRKERERKEAALRELESSNPK